MNEAGTTLQLYVKASNGRPWHGHQQTWTAPGLALTTLGTVVKGPVPCHAVRDGDGRWRRLVGVGEHLGQAQDCMPRAYLVENDRGREVWVLGGQLGLWYAGQTMPMLWVEGGAGDLPGRVARALGLKR